MAANVSASRPSRLPIDPLQTPTASPKLPRFDSLFFAPRNNASAAPAVGYISCLPEAFSKAGPKGVSLATHAQSKSMRILKVVVFPQKVKRSNVRGWACRYFTHYGISLTHASMLALVPPIAGIMVASVAGPAATAQIRAGKDITAVRHPLHPLYTPSTPSSTMGRHASIRCTNLKPGP